jgi:SAM-dependent methyltransferase
VGLEPDLASFEVAAGRVGERGLVLNTTAEEYESEPFDLVCAFEVLEHVEDDRAALEAWLRHLRPEGHVLLSVPFPRDRFGPWDRRAGHFRRYDREDLVATMHAAGLAPVETIVYGFPLGRAMEIGRNAVARLHAKSGSMEELTASSGRQYQPPSWTAGATRVASAPFRVAQRPFAASRHGTGIVARGRLP